MTEGEDGLSDRRGRRGEAQKRGRGHAKRFQEPEPGRQHAAEGEAAGLQSVCEEQRREGERQLKRKPDEEGRLERDVGRQPAGPDKALEVLLDGETDRRHEREEVQRRRRGALAAEAVPDADQHTGDHERQSPDEDRRRVAEVRMPTLRMHPHLVLARRRYEPVGEAVCAKP